MAESSVNTDAPVLVSVEAVSKRFVIRKDNSLKERVVNAGRGKKHKEDFWALRDVSLEIKAGTTIGLIGHNGSGKSTLLKVIGGIIDPTSGRVMRRGRMAALLELGAGFHPDLSGRENVYLNAAILGLSREQTDERFDDILAFSGISDFIDTQVKFYSSGMYVRLAFAVAVHTDPDILLVDEVLAVGDEAFQRKCMDRIKEFQEEGRTIILVTHSLGTVVELCDSAVVLNRGEVVYTGDSRKAVAAFRDLLEERRLAEIEDEEARHAEQQKPITHEPFYSVRTTSVSNNSADPGTVRLGDDLIITMDFEVDQVIDDWVCAVQIDDSRGHAAAGTKTAILDVELAPLQGKRRVGFIFKNCNFGDGKYFVNVSILNRAGQHLFDRPQASSFNSETPIPAGGAMYLESEFFGER
ncbi:ABC transporter ATP-binding protein [Mycetocola spongiae]|uniref:ABC transporter ATP-binding protein n=1 Tax=Mycetocola spongiae TaxID=2859226 RepID=UPI001CF19836|nr:ABC transporter ATP-binding protein [Mycetocola spongiae]UCR90343.1 ABC transporter ATP-binding protein [Mycetocola spongiae]